MQSFSDIDTGYRDEFARSVGAESPMGSVVADTARTLANVGDAATFGLAGRLGRGIASAVGGGGFGEGFASPSDRDRFLAAQPQVAQAPQMTDRERQDEIARRRAALEPPAAAPAVAQAPAVPPQAPAAARVPRTGAARTGKPLVQAAQPVAPAAAPANMEGAVEIIRGQNRSWAVPELGYQEVPDEVYRSGKIGEYMQAQSNNMLDRADPVATELRTRLAEINAQGDNSIRVNNAAPDRDAGGRSLRNELARLELEQKKREAALIQQAMEGTPEQRADATARLSALRSPSGDKGRTQFIADLAKAYSSGLSQPVGPDGKTPLSPEEYANQWLPLLDPGTVKSNSAAPSFEQYVAQIRAKNPGANVTDTQLQAAYKKQFQQGQ
jgi:hypothetical protein